MSDIARFAPNEYKKIAHTLRGRLRNQEIKDSRRTALTRQFLLGGAGAAVGGGLSGKLAASAAAAGREDPTKFGPVPGSMVVGGAISGIGLFLAGKKKAKKTQALASGAVDFGSGMFQGGLYQFMHELASKA